MFWEIDECYDYAYEGLRDILKRTEINVSDRAIPLYSQILEYDENDQPVFESFSGYFYPPISNIQRILGIYWKGEGDRRFRLEVKTPEQMDQIDPEWMTRTGDTPRYAIMYSGNFDTMNMSVDQYRNRIKIKLYPTPPDIDANLQTALYYLNGGSIDTYQVTDDGYGGLANSTAGGIVWGLDEDGNGTADNTVVTGSTSQGIITSILNGTFDMSQYSNYPVIRYVPDIDSTILFTTVGGEITYAELDNYLPRDLQYAIREYMIYRCFDKEGEAQDERKAEKYKLKYEEFVMDHVAENELHDDISITPDKNFGFGRVSNRPDGTVTGVWYNPLRL